MFQTALASKLLRELAKRQGDGGLTGPAQSDGDGGDGGNEPGSQSWWWTPTGLAVRYSIVVAIFVLFFLYFVGGYWHARRRIRKGLPVLAYHRWMVSRSGTLYGFPSRYHNAAPDFRANHPAYYAPGHVGVPQPEGFAMDGYYRPPPPAYNGAEGPPPVYQPPEGASKVLVDQSCYPVRPPPAIMSGGEGWAQASSSTGAPAATPLGAAGARATPDDELPRSGNA